MSEAKLGCEHPNSELLQSATKGFDHLFSNDIVSARELFKKKDDPFHMMGLGVCAFLEAALGMEESVPRSFSLSRNDDTQVHPVWTHDRGDPMSFLV
jgi:hypothetical protein